MPENDNEIQKTEKSVPLISRREFALGSVAMLGSHHFLQASPLPPLSEEAKALKLDKSAEAKELLDARHILDDDIRRVIDNAEKTGRKLYTPENDHLLSKLRIDQTYFYVEYSPVEGGYRIHTAYAHRFNILEEPY